MGTEIERKFLIQDMSWKPPLKSFSIIQGYFPTSGFSLRVRIKDDKAYITLKKSKSELSRHEFEYEIPADDAREIISIFCGKAVIVKTRHVLEYKGFTWEIDEFLGESEGLVVAEIELDSEDQRFEMPPWLGADVTGDPRYLNAFLAGKPYRTWDK